MKFYILFCLLTLIVTSSNAANDQSQKTCENKKTSRLQIGYAQIFKMGETTIGGTRTPPRPRLIRLNDTVNVTYNQITCIYKKPESKKPWKCYADLPGGIYFNHINISCENFDRKSEYIIDGTCSLEYSLYEISSEYIIISLLLFCFVLIAFPDILLMTFLLDEYDDDSGYGYHSWR